MPVYIYIRRSGVTDEHVHYSFSPEDGVLGEMRIDQKTGDMDLVAACPGDESNVYYQCACKAIWNYWAVGKLPQEAQFIYGG
jgi:hypothetical protein